MIPSDSTILVEQDRPYAVPELVVGLLVDAVAERHQISLWVKVVATELLQGVELVKKDRITGHCCEFVEGLLRFSLFVVSSLCLFTIIQHKQSNLVKGKIREKINE